MATPEGDEPTYVLSYSRWTRLVRTGLVLLLVGAALAHWGLAWLDFLRPVIMAADSPDAMVQAASAQPLRPLIAAHVSLLLVAGALALVHAFLPDLSLAGDGLAVRTMLGWQVIPWAAVTTVRIASLEKSSRQLVLVQGRWTRWGLSSRLVSACLGADPQPGLFFTSDIRDFKSLMQRLHREVHQSAPEALFDDGFFSLPASLVLEPTSTLEVLVAQAREEGWSLSLSAQAMAGVAGGLVLVQALILLLLGGTWWKPLGLVALCALEWVIGALYLYALTEIFPASFELREGALLYPLPQIPRALLALPMAMLVAAGVPFLAAMLGLAGVLWAVLLTALLVQRIYRLESMLPAMVGGALQAVFQFIIVAIAFSR